MIFLIYFCAACYAFFFWNRRRNLQDPPLLPGALPIIGHAHLWIGDTTHLWRCVKKMSSQCLEKGGVTSLLIGPKTVYVLTDPDDTLTVTNTCTQKAEYYEFVKPWLGDGLLTADVLTWKNHRKLLNPAFNQVLLDRFLGVFNKQARSLVEDFSVEERKGLFDHWHYLRINALETFCLTSLGASDHEENIFDKEYIDATETMLDVIMERYQTLWMHIQFIYNITKLKRKQDRLLTILHNKSYKVIQQRKEELNPFDTDSPNSSRRKYKALLDLLLELADDEKSFTDLKIREHLDTMIVAGHDTSARVLLFTLTMIGSYPEVQQRIYLELQEVLDDCDRDVEKADLPKMIYLEAVIKETLRLFPIAPMIGRNIDKDIKLKNYTLKQGKTCILSIYGILHDPKWGPDAEIFRPERWLDQTLLPENHLQFAAFGMGRRVCIGKSFALMHMKTTLAHVLRHYRITADYNKLTLALPILLKAVSGHHITIDKRNLLQEVLDDCDRDVEKADLPKMIYLEAVIKETLRLFPIAPMIGRNIDKDIKLTGVAVTMYISDHLTPSHRFIAERGKAVKSGFTILIPVYT